MNQRERYLETLLFGQPDHVPLSPGGPRESTRAAWHRQGLPEGVSHVAALCAELDLPPDAFLSTATIPTSTRMIPTFEEKVLEHRDGHYIVQDWMGAITEISDTYDYTYIRHAKDFVTRKWHRFPVSGPEEWERISWRYDASDPMRYPDEAACRELETSGKPTVLRVNGPFWQMREWVGFENLCLLLIEQPEFVQQMTDFWRAFTLEAMEETMRRVRVDAVALSEDMAYKAHSMISPAMTRRFLQPTYSAWKELTRSYDCQVLSMDSDGEISVLIPVWIESGINVAEPMEVAAGNDLAAFRARWGKQMAYTGGIDKRAIAKGGDVIREELALRIPPLFKDGGYLPSCDHGVPPDISWPNFVEYTRLLAQYCGWL